jgi:hypothetical protein
MGFTPSCLYIFGNLSEIHLFGVGAERESEYQKKDEAAGSSDHEVIAIMWSWVMHGSSNVVSSTGVPACPLKTM